VHSPTSVTLKEYPVHAAVQRDTEQQGIGFVKGVEAQTVTP
jgi:hypothetical protein